MSDGKIIVVSAPSGCGKSTIINSILDTGKLSLNFSVSATNRPPRPGEEHGTHYYFLTTDEFRNAVSDGEFVEWEEVYPGRFYGTLRSELDRMIGEGLNVILDIDVKGALNVKKLYGVRARTIFIEPPSIDALRKRLEARGTDTPQLIDMRINRAEYELSFAPQFDTRVINDNLDAAVAETEGIITEFIK
ncbi:MAG: guanylate kinase [Muribaculaceae bacterium]|nr:guanylate kinase [Muribaculaceae bacterium]